VEEEKRRSGGRNGVQVTASLQEEETYSKQSHPETLHLKIARLSRVILKVTTAKQAASTSFRPTFGKP
jgi:hypothetical protein